MLLPTAKLLKALRSDCTSNASTLKATHHTVVGFLLTMAFQPSKQQLDNDIPAACKAINAILVQLQKATGADDQFIARILEGLARQWRPNINQDGFGFR